MLGRLLTRLYTHLLKLYPDRFLDEFGGEMGDVFVQALSRLDDSEPPSIIRRLKMVHLFFREVWYFPPAYLDARRYLASLRPEDGSPGMIGEQDTKKAWGRRHASWGEALIGALPFLLYGLAYLFEGVVELAGYNYPILTLLDRSLNHPAVTLTAPKGVYIASLLGLVFGVWRGFPRWSYVYLGMCFNYSWFSSNFRYGEDFNLWPFLPTVAAIVLGLLLVRSLQPLVRLLQGSWNDWTRLSLALYAFILPMMTVIFFDDDWGVTQLYGLVFDTVLLAAGAVAFLRAGTTWGRVVSLEAAFVILVFKGLLGGWLDGQFWPAVSFFVILFCFLLLPAVIGLVRRGVNALNLQ